MANKGPLFVTGDYLREGDFLQSANGYFCAFLHDTGDLCIYRSPTPDGSTKLWCSGVVVAQGPKCAYLHDTGDLCIYNSPVPDGKTNIWQSNCYASQGKKCAYLHNDGNLCIYNSAAPDASTYMWQSKSGDIITDFEIVDISYDLQNAKITSRSEPEVYRQTLHNNTGVEQTSTISGEASISETIGWSDTLGIKVGVSTTFKCEVPFIFEGKITVSVEIWNEFTWNGSKTETKSWGFETNVTVPPHKTYTCHVQISKDTIVVPYTMKGTVVFKSGARLDGQKINGIYSGTCAHDSFITIAEQDAITGILSHTKIPIKATIQHS